MRRVALVVAASLLLGGCVTDGSTTGSTPAAQPTVSQAAALANQIQNSTAKICGFVPTVATVASIVASFTAAGPLVDVAGGIATAICKAVAPVNPSMRAARRKAAPPPTINGVVIEGYFIR